MSMDRQGLSANFENQRIRDFVTLKLMIMTQIFSMVLLFAIAIAVTLMIIIIRHARSQKKGENLLNIFEQAADVFNLKVSKQLVLEGRAFGYDKINRILLFVAHHDAWKDKYYVNLDEIRNCVVVKSYGPLEDRVKLGTVIKMVALQLNYKSGASPVQLPFYIKTIDPESELRERTAQARWWEAMLSTDLNKSKRIQKERSLLRGRYSAGTERNFA